MMKMFSIKAALFVAAMTMTAPTAEAGGGAGMYTRRPNGSETWTKWDAEADKRAEADRLAAEKAEADKREADKREADAKAAAQEAQKRMDEALAPYFTGDGGKGKSIAILVPQYEGPQEVGVNLPALV